MAGRAPNIIPGKELHRSNREIGEREDLSLEEPNYEGVRIAFPGGWCLLRKSLHDPILPVNMASDEPGGCDGIAAVMKEFLSSYEGLDLSVMK